MCVWGGGGVRLHQGVILCVGGGGGGEATSGSDIVCVGGGG